MILHFLSFRRFSLNFLSSQELKKPLGSDAIQLFDDENLVWTISRVSLSAKPGTFTGRVVLTNFRLFVLDEQDSVVVCAYSGNSCAPL